MQQLRARRPLAAQCSAIAGICLFVGIVGSSSAATIELKSGGRGRVSYGVTDVHFVDIGRVSEAELLDPVVFTTRTGNRYHRGGCMYLSKSCIPMKLTEAVDKQLTPCKRCKPPQ